MLINLTLLNLEILRNVTFVFGITYLAYLNFSDHASEKQISTSESQVTKLETKAIEIVHTKAKTSLPSAQPQHNAELLEVLQSFLNHARLPKEEYQSIKKVLHDAFLNREISDAQYTVAIEQINQKLYWDQKFATFSDLE